MMIYIPAYGRDKQVFCKVPYKVPAVSPGKEYPECLYMGRINRENHMDLAGMPGLFLLYSDAKFWFQGLLVIENSGRNIREDPGYKYR